MTKVREHWSSKLSFLFAAVGSAIGLGVLWKFPYVVGQNGGGLFLVTYMACILIIGIPVLIAELFLGRESQRASVGAFGTLSRTGKSWHIAGWFGVLSSFLIMSFYSVVAGWGMSYILMSLEGFQRGLSADQVSGVFDKLSRSGAITIFWHFLFTLITAIIVMSGVRKGIEKWSKLMTRALFIILVGLFLYCIHLDGFMEAVRFVFEPKADSFKFSTALEALGLAFFTLSLGQGIMISYGSYMKKEENIPQLAAIVSFSVIFVAILAALTIFPVVFTFGFKPAEGAGLVFKTLPFLFGQLPGSLIISTFFFILFVFTALTSSIPFIEVVSTNFMELRGYGRQKAVICTAVCTFLFGIPSALAGSNILFKSWNKIYGYNFLDTIDHLVSDWIIPIGGLLTTCFVGWALDKKRLENAFVKPGFWPNTWRYTMRYLTPVLIILIVLQKSGIIDFDRLFRG